MGTQRKNVPIEKAVLMTLAGVGILAAVAIAPGVGPALRVFGFGNRRYPKRYVDNAVSRLKRRGLITYEERKGRRYLRLTAKGKRVLLEHQKKQLAPAVDKPRKWDGKWRVITFDIGEHKRASRNQLRDHLRSFGFVQLQRSVWVYPYECEEIIVMLKANLRIGKDVLYLTVERLENDRGLRTRFAL